MKRDTGPIRSILLQVERHAADSASMQLRIETHSREEVSYHVRLLVQVGYIDAICTKALADLTWVPMGFTWKGHELLDDIRDEAVWACVAGNALPSSLEARQSDLRADRRVTFAGRVAARRPSLAIMAHVYTRAQVRRSCSWRRPSDIRAGSAFGCNW